VVKPAFLLDTNVCIYLLEALSEAAREQVEGRRPGEVVTSAIAFAEVMQGLDLSDAKAVAAVDRLFRAVPVLPYDEAAARAYARVPYKRARFDRLIAAHALALDVTLVTNNEADFRDIPGLSVENWVQAS
jgi:tRNA(fMet)-specific endonuclease VapC